MEEEKRFPIGPGPEDKKPGLGSLLGKLLTRGKQTPSAAGRSGREEVEDKSFTFDASQFMVDQFKQKGVQPKIIGESPDGQSFVIETPMGGSMIISLKDFINNFGEPPMKFKGIERGADDQPYRFATGGRVNYSEGTKMASAPDPMDERNSMMEMLSEKYYGKPLKDLTPKEIEMLEEAFDDLVGKKETETRMMAQTGGITESRVLPPEFIEAAQRTFLTDLATQSGMPSVTTATAKQPGETDAQFAQRQAQAQQFNITRAGMAELAPTVEPESQLQKDARAMASGLGSFQPFLTKAADAATAATALTGTGVPLPTGVQAGSIEAYMSPYQQQVINTTMAEFDRQAAIRANQQAAATLGTPGAFGGGREGVQRAEYQAASDRNRAQTFANLQQQGFQNAAARRQQDLANQMGISNLQSGLGARAQDFARAQISGLGTLGAAQQAQGQAVRDAARQTAQMAIQEPRQALARFGQGIAAITPGAGEVTIAPTAAEAAGASPLMKALGLGLAGADIYGRIF